jgi:hypothetical protein
VSAYGHAYVSGTCIDCGAAKPSSTSVTISFSDKANRTTFTTTQQVWVQNGITVTNNKASATSDVADYANPARFYKGSTVIISYPSITKIEINCSGLDSKYVNPWKNAPAGGTVAQSGSVITIEFSTPVDSITFANLSAQARAHSITVYGGVDTSSCTHANTSVIGATAPSCTVPGHTGKTRCETCGDIVSIGTEIPAGHTWGEWITSCAPTCTDPGEERRDCTACDEFETIVIDPTGHADSDENGICDNCSSNLAGNPEEGSGSTDDNSGNNSGDEAPNNQTALIVTISACGAAVVCAAAIFVIKRKKK